MDVDGTIYCKGLFNSDFEFVRSAIRSPAWVWTGAAATSATFTSTLPTERAPTKMLAASNSDGRPLKRWIFCENEEMIEWALNINHKADGYRGQIFRFWLLASCLSSYFYPLSLCLSLSPLPAAKPLVGRCNHNTPQKACDSWDTEDISFCLSFDAHQLSKARTTSSMDSNFVFW